MPFTTRRSFLGAAVAAPLAAAARPQKDDISLAAWSLNRSFRRGKWKLNDLPRICRETLDLNGLELVNQFFDSVMLRDMRELKELGDGYGVEFVLLMIDGEGNMVAPDKAERKQAAITHRKWVDIAHYLGCHAVRCNLGGSRQGWESEKDEIVKRAADSFHQLLEYSEESGLNVLIENHGGASSDPEVLAAIMKEVDHPRFGTLPDFGNLNEGADPYEVTSKLMPWAQGVSVKAQWNPAWFHRIYDLTRLIKICKDAGYSGYWGIESGFNTMAGTSWQDLGDDLVWHSELTAIHRTKKVIEKALGIG